MGGRELKETRDPDRRRDLKFGDKVLQERAPKRGLSRVHLFRYCSLDPRPIVVSPVLDRQSDCSLAA